MKRSLSTALLALVAVGTHMGSEIVSRAQPSTSLQPPVPFEDVGACPFEGCIYREWIARQAVAIRTAGRINAPVAFRVRAGEKATALTGVVITVKAGRVQFRRPQDLSSSDGTIRVVQGETLYLLTYQGEGFSKVWFKGRLYRDVDITGFFTGVCEDDPNRCTGEIIEQSQTEWWVQIRNRAGKVGWTHEPEKFDGKDALGKPRI
jgi:hypothetical protein